MNIGLLKNEFIFVFDQPSDLAEPFTDFLNKAEGNSDGCLILNNARKLVGTINRNDFSMIPDLKPGERYWIFVPERNTDVTTFPTEKGSEVNTQKGREYPFIFVDGRPLTHIGDLGI